MSRYRSPRFASWRRRDIRLRHVLACSRNARVEAHRVKRRPPVLSISDMLRSQRAFGMRYGVSPLVFRALAGGSLAPVTDPADMAMVEGAFGVRLA